MICLTLTVIWNFWVIWLVWQWRIGAKLVEVRSRCQHAIFSNVTCAKLRQLIYLSAAFSRPLLWPSDGVYFSFSSHVFQLQTSPYALNLSRSVLKRTWLFGAAPKHSETQKPGKNARGTQKNKCCHLLRALLSVFLLEVQQLVLRSLITVMSHFRHSWCIEISCLLGRFSLDASKGTWRMMWRQDSSSHWFWNLSVWMSKHAQVAQLVGYVSENAAYHHGEMSLVLPSSICVLKGSPGWILKAKHMRLKVMDVMMSLTNASIFPVSTDLILVCWHLGRML